MSKCLWLIRNIATPVVIATPVIIIFVAVSSQLLLCCHHCSCHGCCHHGVKVVAVGHDGVGGVDTWVTGLVGQYMGDGVNAEVCRVWCGSCPCEQEWLECTRGEERGLWWCCGCHCG